MKAVLLIGAYSCWLARCVQLQQLDATLSRQQPGGGGIAYQVLPKLMTPSSLKTAEVASIAGEGIEREIAASAAVQQSAESLSKASATSVVAAKQHLLASIAAKKSAEGLDHTVETQRRVEVLREKSQQITAALKEWSSAVAADVVEPVVFSAIAGMDSEAYHLVEQQQMSRKAASEQAALAAQAAEKAFQMASNQSRSAALSYAAQASVLATNVTQLHNEAVQLAAEALAYQERGNTTEAASLHRQAQQLIREAQQKKLQAEGIHAVARELNAEVPVLAQQGRDAAAFAKYQIQPWGSRPLETPPLPVPLRLVSNASSASR
eukprot:CAMPEP_0178418172 /NCGR_PEP_ID=MMETSP0689_2-20121128/24951_1 /TAXON_ID=160604 /ORGANISM="Amphidinium massartii, Strain CS-259" /LENGTH=321 /DNA_ID=CAMNT_0020039557 /DNA_START=127 /DNA_END=1092 /DNA_ORIENTATION=-